MSARDTPSERLLTFEEVAERLAVSPNIALAWLRDGSLPAVRIGEKGLLRMREADLNEYIYQLAEERKANKTLTGRRRVANADDVTAEQRAAFHASLDRLVAGGFLDSYQTDSAGKLTSVTLPKWAADAAKAGQGDGRVRLADAVQDAVEGERSAQQRPAEPH